MDPYHKLTLNRYRWVRRCRYGRGVGVHSPSAFALVQSLLRPHTGYYATEEVRAIVPTTLGGLWFRCVARLAPVAQYYALKSGEVEELPFRTVGQVADTRSPQRGYEELGCVEPHSGLLTDELANVVPFLSHDNNWVLLKDIRVSREREEAFLELLEHINKGIVLDLYDSALLFNKTEERYIYRSTL